MSQDVVLMSWGYICGPCQYQDQDPEILTPGPVFFVLDLYDSCFGAIRGIFPRSGSVPRRRVPLNKMCRTPSFFVHSMGIGFFFLKRRWACVGRENPLPPPAFLTVPSVTRQVKKIFEKDLFLKEKVLSWVNLFVWFSRLLVFILNELNHLLV